MNALGGVGNKITLGNGDGDTVNASGLGNKITLGNGDGDTVKEPAAEICTGR